MMGMSTQTIVAMLLGFANPKIRSLEDILPDHDQAPPATV